MLKYSYNRLILRYKKVYGTEINETFIKCSLANTSISL